MAITPEQRAVLQLLLERGQSYSDLATLLGVDESEVRSRARAALTELGGADPDRNVGLTDYLLGQADPIGRADAVRHLQADPEDHQLASDLAAILREAFPNAELPRLPGEPRQPRRARAAQAGATSRISGIDLSPRQTRLLAVLGAGAVILIAAVLAITGAFAGSGGDESTASTSSTTGTSTTASDGQTVERVKLKAPSGGNAKGDAVFGLATGDQLYVDVTIDGLDPAPQGKTYVIWLMIQGNKGYPLSPITMSDSGQFHDRFAVPSAVLPIAARTQVVDVSIAPDDQIASLVQSAIKHTQLLLEKPGETVLSGDVPKPPQGSGGSGGGSAG
ncbi:MAG: hypothetical protein ACJ75R_10540 [Solirubrobacterales bacterium]